MPVPPRVLRKRQRRGGLHAGAAVYTDFHVKSVSITSELGVCFKTDEVEYRYLLRARRSCRAGELDAHYFLEHDYALPQIVTFDEAQDLVIPDPPGSE